MKYHTLINKLNKAEERSFHHDFRTKKWTLDGSFDYGWNWNSCQAFIMNSGWGATFRLVDPQNLPDSHNYPRGLIYLSQKDVANIRSMIREIHPDFKRTVNFTINKPDLTVESECGFANYIAMVLWRHITCCPHGAIISSYLYSNGFDWAEIAVILGCTSEVWWEGCTPGEIVYHNGIYNSGIVDNLRDLVKGNGGYEYSLNNCLGNDGDVEFEIEDEANRIAEAEERRYDVVFNELWEKRAISTEFYRKIGMPKDTSTQVYCDINKLKKTVKEL